MVLIGIDVSMCNLGWAAAEVQPDGGLFILESNTIRTEITWRKGDKPYNVTGTTLDIILRAKRLNESLRVVLEKYSPTLICAEIMTGAQTSTTAKAMGVACAITGIACHKIVPVSPNNVKRLTTGLSKATKKEMCEWAIGAYPEIEDWWDCHSDGSPKHTKLEHEADAIAIVHSGYGIYKGNKNDSVFNIEEHINVK